MLVRLSGRNPEPITGSEHDFGAAGNRLGLDFPIVAAPVWQSPRPRPDELSPVEEYRLALKAVPKVAGIAVNFQIIDYGIILQDVEGKTVLDSKRPERLQASLPRRCGLSKR